MAHVNTAKVQTADGIVEVTKTSTHRDYVAVSAVQFLDGTQSVLSWHLTTEAAVKYTQSSEAQKLAAYAAQKSGKEVQLVTFLPVTTKLTGKDKPAAPATHNEAVEAFQAEEAAPEAPAGLVRQNPACKCGCGQLVNGSKTNYRPGHDAKHASLAARRLSQGRTEGLPADELNRIVEALPTANLRSKALGMAHRLDEKAAARAAKNHDNNK